jgi:hypothetical protein
MQEMVRRAATDQPAVLASSRPASWQRSPNLFSLAPQVIVTVEQQFQLWNKAD